MHSPPHAEAVNSDKPTRASGTWLFEGIKNGVAGSIMAVQQSETMPDDVRQCFRDAVRLFYCWRLGEPIPTVRFRTMVVSLSGVCDLVLAYRNEPLPLDVHHELLALIEGPHMSLKAELMIDPSFETGARCLDKLIENRRAGER